MTIIWIILAIVYVIGIFVAYNMMKDWEHHVVEKVVFAIIWPLVGFLYGIHYLHNK